METLKYWINLLRKYIDHVGHCEGVDFLGSGYQNVPNSPIQFTDKEWADLRAVRDDDGI